MFRMFRDVPIKELITLLSAGLILCVIIDYLLYTNGQSLESPDLHDYLSDDPGNGYFVFTRGYLGITLLTTAFYKLCKVLERIAATENRNLSLIANNLSLMQSYATNYTLDYCLPGSTMVMGYANQIYRGLKENPGFFCPYSEKKFTAPVLLIDGTTCEKNYAEANLADKIQYDNEGQPVLNRALIKLMHDVGQFSKKDNASIFIANLFPISFYYRMVKSLLKMKLNADPDNILAIKCPISGKIMKHPVVCLADGYSYELAALQQNTTTQQAGGSTPTSPMSGVVLYEDEIKTNPRLLIAITHIRNCFEIKTFDANVDAIRHSLASS